MDNLKWMDIHAHLNMLETTPEETLRLAKEQGVEKVITIGTCPKDLPIVLDLAQKYAPDVYCTLGVHPHDAIEFDEECEKFILDNLSNDRVVAVGEIGLDYYYDNSPREKQREVFRRHLEIAIQYDLPVQIHTRDAEEDTVNILKEFGGKVKGVIHCFTGTQYLADECLKLGLNISISGVATFKSADELREVVRSLPLDRIHIETDSPFLAPVPFRGKKNMPAYVTATAQKVAELKGVTEKELSEMTNNNGLKLFSKIKWNNN